MNTVDNAASNSDSVEETAKLPFKRLQYALNQVVNVAIPLHVQLLRQQTDAIENLKDKNRELELHCEQVKAAKTVQLLKADLFELEKLNLKVRDEDRDLFHNKIQSPTREVIEILSSFMELHSDILVPLPETESDFSSNTDFPPLVCKIDELDSDFTDEQILESGSEVQAQKILSSGSKYSLEKLSFIQKQLSDVNALIKQFASLVFRQKENVDTIEGNIEQTRENVFFGTKFLKKASDYKAATFPIAGAVIGGLVLGPAGALAGFKLLGSIACVASGSVIGYGAGLKLKKQHQVSCDIEMKALTYPSKSHSRSTPDLTLESDQDKS